MTDRTFTQKELYQFVTEYSREAREEGFDMSVGDFVDWVAARDEQPEECRPEIKTWLVNGDKTYCQVCGHKLIDCRCLSSKSEQDKPVLPEKLAIHSSRNYRDPDVVLDILLETQATVNDIIGYLKGKEQGETTSPEVQKAIDDVNKTIEWSRQEREKTRQMYPRLFSEEANQ